MARPKKSDRIFAKSEGALVAAIEAYNKPTSLYREENFCILALNAWELMIKARLLAQHSEDTRCLYIRDWQQKKNGERSKKFTWSKSRSGNIYTLGLGRAIVELEKFAGGRLETAVKSNLAVVTEIRDNSLHFINAGPEIAKLVLEIGTACVANFVKLAQRWFNQDLSKFNLYLMPIGFVPVSGIVAGIALTHEERNLIRYITDLARSPENEPGEMSVSLEIQVTLKRAGSKSEGSFALTNDPTDPSATLVYLSYDEMRKDYPWEYEDLREHLKSRYLDFIQNAKFFEIKKSLRDEPKYVHLRRLVPDNPKSPQKEFYNSAILNEFDKRYARAS